jgi:hypothetical protein
MTAWTMRARGSVHESLRGLSAPRIQASVRTRLTLPWNGGACAKAPSPRLLICRSPRILVAVQAICNATWAQALLSHPHAAQSLLRSGSVQRPTWRRPARLDPISQAAAPDALTGGS